MSADLDAALRGVHAARRVETTGGVTRDQMRHMAAVVDRRLLEADLAGATGAQLAEALGLSLNRARERLRRAQERQGPPQPVELRNPRREVPMCARPAPPPWPVSARCRARVGHTDGHDYSRRHAT